MDVSLMPQRPFHMTTHAFTMDHLILEFERGTRTERYANRLPWLLGHRLPEFQRPLVWTQAQQIAFIESAWLGLHLGSYLVNRYDKVIDKNETIHKADRLLLDGQQRLEAIRAFLSNEIAVFGYEWGQLPKLDHRRFESTPFACARTAVSDDVTLRMIYDKLNFGGTAHTDDQRAITAA